MNLETEMRKVEIKERRQNNSPTDIVQIFDGINTLSIPDALTIARKYAEDCCKKQREICATNMWNNYSSSHTFGELYNSVNEAPSPLATEVQ